MAKITLIDVIEGMNHHWQHNYFIQSNSVSLSQRSQQQITLKNNKLEITATTVITESKYNFYFTFPFLEFNALDILLPLAKQKLWNYLLLEIQSDLTHFQFFMPDRGAQLHNIYFPPSEEVILKLGLQFNFEGKIQKVPIFAVKLLMQKPYNKQSSFLVTEISPKFTPQFFALIDGILATLHTKKPEFKDENNSSVSCKYFTNTISFLHRYCFEKNRNCTDNNLKRFTCNQPIFQTQIEKLSKNFTQQNVIIDNLPTENYQFSAENYSFTVILQVISKIEEKKSALGAFLEGSENYPSYLAAGYCFSENVHSLCVLGAQAIDLKFQEFEVGTGGLAIGKVENSDVVYQSYRNQNNLLKYVANKQKSVLQLAKKGVSTFVVFYSRNKFLQDEFKFSSKQMQKALENKDQVIVKKMSDEIQLKLFIRDQFFVDVNGIEIVQEQVKELPKEELTSLRNEFLLNYYKDGSKEILLIPSENYITQTFIEAKAAREKFLEEERIRKETAAKIQHDKEEKLRLEKEEQERIQFEKEEAERRVKEEEARLIEQQRLQELEEKRQAEEARQQAEEQKKFLELQVKQLKKQKGRSPTIQLGKKQIINKKLPYFLGQPYQPKEVIIDPELLKMKVKADERMKQRQDEIASNMQNNVFKMQQLKTKFDKDMLVFQEKIDISIANQISKTIENQMNDEDNAIQYIEEQEKFLVQQQQIIDNYEKQYNAKMEILEKTKQQNIIEDEEKIINNHTVKVNKLEKKIETILYTKQTKIQNRLGRIGSQSQIETYQTEGNGSSKSNYQ